MRPKSIGLTPNDLAQLDDKCLDLVARSVSSTVDRALDKQYDPKFAAASAGETDAERYFYVGLEWLEFFIRYGRLSPFGTILDIGCGAGRMAKPLSLYLNEAGSYYGFDPVSTSVDFCRKTIHHPRFSFQHINLFHPLYNPNGTVRSESYEFPYPDNFFDVAFAASVFTHIDVESTQNYFRQIERVLRPGGTAILSFFAIPQESAVPMGNVTPRLGLGTAEYSYRFRKTESGQYLHCTPDGAPMAHYSREAIGDPVAFESQTFSRMCAAAGLTVIDMLTGAWNGETYRYGWQDMALVSKI